MWLLLQVNVADEPKMDAVFEKHGPFSSVIHFAALKAVGESMANPLEYYSNNIAGTMTLLKVMEKHKCTRIGMCYALRLVLRVRSSLSLSTLQPHYAHHLPACLPDPPRAAHHIHSILLLCYGVWLCCSTAS